MQTHSTKVLYITYFDLATRVRTVHNVPLNQMILTMVIMTFMYLFHLACSHDGIAMDRLPVR